MHAKRFGRSRCLRGNGGRGIFLSLACLTLAPAVRAGSSVSVPILTKAFAPDVIGAAGTTTLTFTLTNASGAPAQNNVSFTDTLPAGLIVSAVPNVGGTCLNAAAATNATANGDTIAVTNLDVAAGASVCTVTVDVTNAEGQFNASCVSSPAAFTNNSGNVSVSNVQNSVQASCVRVLVPILAKAFAPAIINDGETTVLTFTLANPSGSPASSIVGFTDTLPSGLRLANPPAVGGTCANAAAATTANAGEDTVGVSFLQVSAGEASCTVTVNVTNKPGQGNASCSLNPSAFTNFAANLEAVNAIVSSKPACLVVNGIPAPPAAEVPALSTAMLALLAGSLAAAGIFLARRRSG